MENEFFRLVETSENGKIGYLFRNESEKKFEWSEIFEGLVLEDSIFLFNNVKFTNSTAFPVAFYRGKHIAFNECEFNFSRFFNIRNSTLEFHSCTFSSYSLYITGGLESKIVIRNLDVNNLFFEGFEGGDIKINPSKDLYVNVSKFKDVKKIDVFQENNIDDVSVRLIFSDSELYELVLSRLNLKEIEYENVSIDYFKVKRCTGDELGIINEELKGNLKVKNIELFYNKINLCYIASSSKDFLFKVDSLNILHSSKVSVHKLEAETLILEGGENSELNFWNCKLKNLKFIDFSAIDPVEFGEISLKKEAELTLINSTLSNVSLSSSFLHGFEKINNTNSTIFGIELVNFQFLETGVIRNMNSSLLGKVNFTRELSHLLKEQGNLHYAQKYKALEHDFRSKINDSSISWFDKQVLNLNYWSNVHGTMPQKALFWIFVFVLIQFGFINLDIAIQTNIPYEAGFDFLKQNYSYFIKPFTFLTDVEGNYKPFGSDNMRITFSWWVKGFDFLYKIFYAYLLYQFIAAFRKFNK